MLAYVAHHCPMIYLHLVALQRLKNESDFFIGSVQLSEPLIISHNKMILMWHLRAHAAMTLVDVHLCADSAEHYLFQVAAHTQAWIHSSFLQSDILWSHLDYGGSRENGTHNERKMNAFSHAYVFETRPYFFSPFFIHSNKKWALLRYGDG